MFATDFVYDGTSLSSFNCVICRFDGAAGVEEIEAGAPISFKTVSRNKGNKFSLVDVGYDSYIETTFDICKDPCKLNANESMVIGDNLYLQITRWLLRKEFLQLYFVTNSFRRYYNGAFNISKIMFNDLLYGIRLTFITDSPYPNNGTITKVFSYGGKNLLRYPFRNTTKTDKGITFTDNGDGSITIDGTSTARVYFNFVYTEDVTLETGVDYTLRIGTDELDYKMYLQFTEGYDNGDDSTVFYFHDSYTDPLVFNIPDGHYLFNLSIQIESGRTIDNVTIYPMLTLSSDASTEWETPDYGADKADVGSAIHFIDEIYYTGITTPDLKITCMESGDLTLTNSFTNTNMIVKNCSQNEVITVNGSTLSISSSKSSHKLYNDFNFNFLKIGNTYYDNVNDITSSIKCVVELKYKQIIMDAP